MTNEEALNQFNSTNPFMQGSNKQEEYFNVIRNALEKQIQITSDKERIREAIMRLSMCARKECEICKYKDRPKDLLPSDDCKERSAKNINLIADLLLGTESGDDK